MYHKRSLFFSQESQNDTTTIWTFAKVTYRAQRLAFTIPTSCLFAIVFAVIYIFRSVMFPGLRNMYTIEIYISIGRVSHSLYISYFENWRNSHFSFNTRLQKKKKESILCNERVWFAVYHSRHAIFQRHVIPSVALFDRAHNTYIRLFR